MWYFVDLLLVLMMLSGSSTLNIDNKGRMTFPVRYRDFIIANNEGKLVCTIDLFSSCLLIYPAKAWDVVAQKLLQLSDMHPEQRALKRLLLGYAHDTHMDKHGRLLIPPTLRNYAMLNKQTMLIGQLNKFELWDEALWNEQTQINKKLVQGADLSNFDQLQDFSL